MLIHRFTLASALALVCACPMDDDDGGGGDEAGQVPPTLQGSVSRETEIASGEDGVGTLYVAALASCELGAELIGAAAVTDADVSADGSSVSFSIVDLPMSEVALAVFLDDNLDADPMNPLPGPGDMVYADGVGDGVLSCVMALSDEADVEVPLTGTVPSAPPE